MKDIVAILEENKVTLSEEQKKTILKAVHDEGYITPAEHEKKLRKVEMDRDEARKQLEAATETLKSFDGINADEVKTQLSDYEKKIREIEENHKKELYDRDFKDALNTAMGDYRFSSEYAKKSVMSEVQAAGLKLIDGKIVGLNDMIGVIKEKDPSAFLNEQEDAAKQRRAKFTTPITNNAGGKVTMLELMKMKNENPNLDISAYMKGKDDK